ncbi:hypothetical protein HBH95_159070 [Parastagonospora nodorum]|nr:hypothetical protein HBH95_159070 [Parastagonospora nodorum]
MFVIVLFFPIRTIPVSDLRKPPRDATFLIQQGLRLAFPTIVTSAYRMRNVSTLCLPLAERTSVTASPSIILSFRTYVSPTNSHSRASCLSKKGYLPPKRTTTTSPGLVTIGPRPNIPDRVRYNLRLSEYITQHFSKRERPCARFAPWESRRRSE